MIQIGFFNREKEKKIIAAFRKIKEEMNDHLETINENTNEINSNYDYIMQIENKINKLNERLDNIEFMLKNSDDIPVEKKYKNIILTSKEEEIFLLLYSRTGDLLDYREISRSLGYTEEIAQKIVSNMIRKGIPILKKYYDNSIFLILDPDFRNLQAKKNLLDI